MGLWRGSSIRILVKSLIVEKEGRKLYRLVVFFIYKKVCEGYERGMLREGKFE